MRRHFKQPPAPPKIQCWKREVLKDNRCMNSRWSMLEVGRMYFCIQHCILGGAGGGHRKNLSSISVCTSCSCVSQTWGKWWVTNDFKPYMRTSNSFCIHAVACDRHEESDVSLMLGRRTCVHATRHRVSFIFVRQPNKTSCCFILRVSFWSWMRLKFVVPHSSGGRGGKSKKNTFSNLFLVQHENECSRP